MIADEVVEKVSYEEFLKMDEEADELTRLELIFGKVYMMAGASAEHQDILGNIFFELKKVEKETKCHPRVAPYDLKVTCKDEINVVQPDILLYCKDNELPCAVFEILSPSTAYKDKGVKRELFECVGIKEYFLIDPKALTIDKFKLSSKKYHYEGCFGKDDKLKLECIDVEVDLKEVFS